MNRREFTRAASVAIIKRATRDDGQPACERCGAVGCRLEIHHKKMDAMETDKSRKLTADDGELLCVPCHKPETAAQRKVLAKTLAQEAAALGVRKPGKPKFKRKPSKNDERRGTLPPVANGLPRLAREYGIK